MQLFPHQAKALDETKQFNKVGYFLDMGLGKTLVGSEKVISLDAKVNLVVCQKSKVQDWIDHFRTIYSEQCVDIWDLTKKSEFESFFTTINELHLATKFQLFRVGNGFTFNWLVLIRGGDRDGQIHQNSG